MARQYGWRCVPDCRANIAEYHLQLGQRSEADLLFAELKEQYPDDIWLYNNAALAFQDVGDHETAIEWVTGGIEIAFATDDPEGLLAQMTDIRLVSVKALGHEPGELEQRIDAFLESAARRR